MLSLFAQGHACARIGDMEALHRFLDLMRLPVRLVIGALGALAVFFVAPDSWLSAVGILHYKPTEKTSFGILLLVLIGSIFASVAGAVLEKHQTRRFLHSKREMLEALSEEEKSLLRKYIVRGTKTLHLPLNHGVVQGLVHTEVIYRATTVSNPDYGATAFAYNLQPWAWKYLKAHPEILGPADEGGPGDEE